MHYCACLVAFVQIQLCITRLAGAFTKSEKMSKTNTYLLVMYKCKKNKYLRLLLDKSVATTSLVSKTAKSVIKSMI